MSASALLSQPRLPASAAPARTAAAESSRREAVPDVEGRRAAFRGRVEAVLRKIRIARAREESRRIVGRLAERVGQSIDVPCAGRCWYRTCSAL